MISRDHVLRLLKRFCQFMPFVGGWGDFPVCNQFFPTSGEENIHSWLFLLRSGGHTVIFFFCPYKEILRTFFDRNQNSGKEKWLLKMCPFSLFYFIYKILNLWEWFLIVLLTRHCLSRRVIMPHFTYSSQIAMFKHLQQLPLLSVHFYLPITFQNFILNLLSVSAKFHRILQPLRVALDKR